MYAHSIGACLLLLGLRALAGLAEEAKEGFGGRLGDSVLPGPCPCVRQPVKRKHPAFHCVCVSFQCTHTHKQPPTEAGPQVCELALRGLVEAAAPPESAPHYSPADRAVLLEACAQTITG